eukprot:scaffold1299_cov246-Pinguiococcus_pyrenoidosus.AAC.17
MRSGQALQEVVAETQQRDLAAGEEPRLGQVFHDGLCMGPHLVRLGDRLALQDVFQQQVWQDDRVGWRLCDRVVHFAKVLPRRRHDS